MLHKITSRSISRFRSLASRVTSGVSTENGAKSVAQVSAEYWTTHNVTAHKRFVSAAESLTYFHWRNAQYYNYAELMPVDRCDEKTVLDLGCGPGNDLVGFGAYSRPTSLLGCDVSPTALDEARDRLRLHAIDAELTLLSSDSDVLPFETRSIDYLHCSGVLHHLSDPGATLRECRRVLRGSGEMRVMVYNRQSIWFHLYVAYLKQIVENQDPGIDIDLAFARTTDGPDCPISRAYDRKGFVRLAEQSGFVCEFLGAAISMWEMKILPHRFDAIMDQRFASEHRDFLLALELDARGYPLYEGHYAGIDACFSLRPA